MVEHNIGGAMILKVVREECRLRKYGFIDIFFGLSVGLHNWRFSHRI